MPNEIQKLWNQFTEKNWFNIKEYPFNSEQETIKKEASKNSEKLLRNTGNPSVAVTGAVEGSILEGFGEGSKGGIIKLHYIDGNYSQLVEKEKQKRFNNKRVFSSCSKIVEGIINNNELKLQFLNNLNQEQYIGLSDQEKLNSLLEYTDKFANHRDIGGNDKHWRIQVIRLPNKMIEDLYNEFGDNANQIIDIIVNKKEPYWYVHDLVSLHTNSGSMSSSKQLMTFRRSAWRLIDTNINNNFQGKTIILEDQGDIYVLDDISFKYKKNKKDTILNQDIKLGIQATIKNKSEKDVYYWINKLLNKSKQEVESDIFRLDQIDQIKFIGTGVYKSLMQKLIRFQPIKCKLSDDYLIDSDLVLIYSMFKLLTSPPQYLPSLHRSVPGVENLTKRLGVIAFEDSDPNIIVDIDHLFAAALLSQKVPTWFPSNNLILKWFKIGLQLQKSTNAIKYNTKFDDPICLEKCNWSDPFQKSAMLLRIIGSFEGDMRMLEYQVSYKEKIHESNGERPEYMLYPHHSFDQHVKPNIVLFFSDDLEYSESKNIFGGRVSKLFHECTGLNPRRNTKWKEFSNNSFVKMVQKAQTDYFQLLKPQELIPNNIDSRQYKLKLCDEWIAGSLGVFSLGNISVNRGSKSIKCQMTASLNPFDINSIVVTPKSSVRGNIDSIKYAFDDDMQKLALKKAEKLLSEGKLKLSKIKKNNLPLDIYNWFIKKENSNFKLSEDGKEWMELDKVNSWDENFPIYVNNENKYNGIVADCELLEEIKKFSIETRRRVLSYIKHSKSSFKMATISRDGGTGDGSEQISIHDSQAFKFFLRFSELIPYAIRPSIIQPFEFKVEKTLMLKHLRELIESTILENEDCYDIWYKNGKEYLDNYNRTLYDFQKEAIKRMIKDKVNNKTRHFLNIKVGLGKTLIVLTYLIKRKLSDIKYIIYTMPKSAYGSVIDEISAMGFDVYIYGSSKSIDPIWKKSLEDISKINNNKIVVKPLSNKIKFKKGVINLIEHDGLRKYKESLLNIISESIFIIDEVHKCLPKGTQRSGIALEISKLAKETIAFTGTPIINSQGAKTLINWLEASVDFNLNLDNFGVATNSMIAYSVKTDVKIQNIDTRCKLNNEEKELYKKAIKKSSLNQMVEICYQACNRKIIDIAIDKFNNKVKVFIVAKNRSHQIFLANHIISKIEAKVVCIGFNKRDANLNEDCNSLPYINLTDKSVLEGETDYDIVITRQSFSTGYNLTRMTCMISSVYFSSEPTREQLRGRINRLDQNNKEISYITVMTGILELIHNNYEKVKLVSRCLQTTQIKDKDKSQLKKILHVI